MAILISFLAGLGIPTAVILIIYTHPVESQKWISMLFSLLAKIWKGFRYTKIKYDIQSKINSFVNTLNADSATTFPKVVINWVGKGKEEVIFEDGRIMLIMRDKNHNTKNLVHASYLFVSETLLRRSKVHISKTQKISLDLFSTKLILEKESPAALEYFISNYFIPELSKHDKISDLLKQYNNIQKAVLFFPVLVQELTFLGNTIYLEKPSSAIIQEVSNLVTFLENFANRQVGEIGSETFTGKYMRCAIRIIASRPVREAGRIEGACRRIVSWIQAGYPNIYIIGANTEDNKAFMDDVISSVQTSHSELKIVKKYEFVAEIEISGKKKNVKDVLTHLHYPKSVKYILAEQDLVSPMAVVGANATNF
jgi:hypothetical protein